MTRAIVVVSAAFIFYTFFWNIAVFTLPGMILVLGALMAFLLIFRALSGEKFVLSSNRALISFAIFILFEGVVSLFVARDANVAISSIINVCEYFLVAIAVYYACTSSEDNKRTIYWVVCLSVALCAVAMASFGVLDERTGQVVLGDLNSNTFATMSMVGLFCSFALFVETGTKAKKTLIVTAIALILAGVLLSASRRSFLIAFLMVMAFLFVYVIPNSMKSNSRRTIFLLVVLVPLMCFFAIQAYGYVLSETGLGARMGNTGYEGDRQRLYFYQLAFELFAQNPVFGIGLNQFQVVNPYGVYSHSLYAESISCFGIAGSLILFGAFLATGKQLSRRRKTEPVCQFAFVSLAILMVSGLFCTLVYDVSFYVYIACLLSAGNCTQKKAMHQEERRIR